MSYASTVDTDRQMGQAVVKALSELWSATDYKESLDISSYSEDDLKAILGQWEHVRRACDAIYVAIRAAYPQLMAWDPIQKERPPTGLD